MSEWMTCPFCGGEVSPVRGPELPAITGILCQRCKAITKWNIQMNSRETFGANEEKWKEKWNRRTNGSD